MMFDVITQPKVFKSSIERCAFQIKLDVNVQFELSLYFQVTKTKPVSTGLQAHSSENCIHKVVSGGQIPKPERETRVSQLAWLKSLLFSISN